MAPTGAVLHLAHMCFVDRCVFADPYRVAWALLWPDHRERTRQTLGAQARLDPEFHVAGGA
jgi:hypothetical protein